MIRKIIFTLLVLSHANLFGQADWTIFEYIEASEGLQHEALFNISQMAAGGVPENINLFVQIHTAGDTSFLYKVEQNHIILLDFIKIGPNTKDNILQTAEKIFPHHPATHHGLFLWNHGFGILVPQYDPQTETWDVEPDGNQLGTCDLLDVDMSKKTKGLLINAHEKTVMGNEDMVQMVKRISQELLNNKKIDLIGFDCCMAAMIEHGYQLKEYVNIIVGSQDCELSDGFDYIALMKHFQDGHTQPKQIAIDIVQDYGIYNGEHAPVGRYTMSAIDLSYISTLKATLDKIADILLELLRLNKVVFKEEFLKLRKECPRFCIIPSYTDLYTLLQNVSKTLQWYNSFELVKDLLILIDKANSLIKKAVIANVTGEMNQNVHGISIYCPFTHIDSTYPPISFAQESSWFTLLKELVN